MEYLWPLIQDTIQKSINNLMDKKYKALYGKLNRLEQNQCRPTQSDNFEFYPRVVNHRDIQFSPEELK